MTEISKLRERFNTLAKQNLRVAGSVEGWAYDLSPYTLTFSTAKDANRIGFEWHFRLYADSIDARHWKTGEKLVWDDLTPEHGVFVRGITVVLDDIDRKMLVSESVGQTRAQQRTQFLEDLKRWR